MPRSFVKDLAGQRFGLLVAKERAGTIRKYAAWRCECACGQSVVVRGDLLRRGLKKSCGRGHRFKPTPKERGITVQHLAEYRAFRGMHKRCEQQSHTRYVDYGGRGIRVCERWKSFAAFVADMGKKPSPAHTIDRKDVNGHYEPGNCRWATSEEQRRNMRNSVYVEYEGKRILLLDVADKLGISRNVVYQRLKLGWSLAEALAVPVRPKKPKRKNKGPPDV